MSDVVRIASYAKVNYTLDILSRRPDGFHNLASVMQTISLADTIEIERRDEPGIAFTCPEPAIPSDSSNLAYRAAEAIMKESSREDGLSIRLHKRIPSQAGLGGGSSNAAFTLLGIKKLLQLDLDDAVLCGLASSLGSDVPFFLTTGTASVRGRGEQVTQLLDGPPLWFVIVKPPEIGISTAWAYHALDAIPERSFARSTRRMEEALAAGEVDRVVSRMTNDFEQAVYAEIPTIAQLHDDFLMARARNSRLCGSGAAVFGVAYSQREAEEVARLMRLKYPEVHVCRAISRSESLERGEAAT